MEYSEDLDGASQGEREQINATRRWPLPNHSPVWAKLRAVLLQLRSERDSLDSDKIIGALIQILIINGHRKKHEEDDPLEGLEYLNMKPPKKFFEKTFPFIVDLALLCEDLFPGPQLLSMQGFQSHLRLSKLQCACVLANMFLCTPTKIPVARFNTYSYMNLHSFPPDNVAYNHHLCLIHYFERIREAVQEQNKAQELNSLFVDYHRRVLYAPEDQVGAWESCGAGMADVTLKAGSIYEASNSLITNFANKLIGGGTLEGGCLQEEILYMLHPECIAGMLFTESMESNEAIVILGAERYTSYEGYGRTFIYKGDYKETAVEDTKKRRGRMITSIDATLFQVRDSKKEFTLKAFMRELNKAYIGSKNIEGEEDGVNTRPVATGKWGCGAFNGNVALKFFAQWLACSRAGRVMEYYTFGDAALDASIKKVTEMKSVKGASVGSIIKKIQAFFREIEEKKTFETKNLFDYFM